MIVRFLAVAGVGGPIRPGKTWFYGGYRLNHQEELTIGHADPATTQLDNWTAKVTHQLTGSSQLVGFFNRRTKLQAERGLGPRSPAGSGLVSAVGERADEGRVPERGRQPDVRERAGRPLEQPVPPLPDADPVVERGGLPAGRLEINTGDYTNAYDYYQFRTLTKPQASGSVTPAHAQGRRRGLPRTPWRGGPARAVGVGVGVLGGSDVRALRGLRRSTRPRSARYRVGGIVRLGSSARYILKGGLGGESPQLANDGPVL